VITARTDVVGSLLRPRELLQARQRLERGEIGPPEFKWVEDAAVEAAIRLQEDAGLAVITDGEMCRLSFQSQLTEAIKGFSDWDLDAFLWATGMARRSGTSASSARRSPSSASSGAAASFLPRSSLTRADGRSGSSRSRCPARAC
jgi:methionine synthase II (cobalamin-independent)